MIITLIAGFSAGRMNSATVTDAEETEEMLMRGITATARDLHILRFFVINGFQTFTNVTKVAKNY